jgi:hypothetical protein
MPRFGTAITCIDGRVQEPVTQWVRDHFFVDYVDMVTEPGPDLAVAHGAPELVETLRHKVLISVDAHGSTVVVVAGHHDCAAHPVEKAQHVADIRQAVQTIRTWNLSATLVGLWVTGDRTVEVVAQ